MYSLLPTAIQGLLNLLLWTDFNRPDATPPLRFQLRHEHAVSNTSRVVLSDIVTSFTPEVYGVNTRHVISHRPSSVSAYSSARFRSLKHAQSDALLWKEKDVVGPHVRDRETLLTLAKMTSNAYNLPADKEWYELGPWNSSYPFGWEPEADGFRGHVFVSEDNSTVVISIKGTSAGWLAGGSGPTVKKDQLNDNLLFSCCCARVGPTWSTVCGCYSGGYKCDQTCVEDSLVGDSLFYTIGTNLYNNVTYMYPNANIWLIGHSLGGSLASLLGATFGVPVVAFEAPGEKLAASRLHLPSPPSLQHITHVYHTADVVAMGTCTGVTSVCGIGGYAMESRCHLGKVILYDTVSKLGWSASARTHGIRMVIDQLLSQDWEPGKDGAEGHQVPEFVEENDCVDCFNWEYGDFKKDSLRTSTEL
ncbi:hypothetical protein PILCRDRAFT_271668 [Piloderma croceum F 1598]|uniref:triacylglycerol lipase n=1 Tax=Piloderma croceum (strain F 1598) TaxID=765440 RepID=A0A0C3BLH8_PILCF|nr:hypothetical protein PILCRDRAFT_271668 [Piloderma croceum F 1598]